MNVKREPAIRRAHPAENLPERPRPVVASEKAATPPPAADTTEGASDAAIVHDWQSERLTEQHNVRIRPSTRRRLMSGVDQIRYRTGDRSITLASLTDQALRELMDRMNVDPPPAAQ